MADEKSKTEEKKPAVTPDEFRAKCIEFCKWYNSIPQKVRPKNIQIKVENHLFRGEKTKMVENYNFSFTLEAEVKLSLG